MVVVAMAIVVEVSVTKEDLVVDDLVIVMVGGVRVIVAIRVVDDLVAVGVVVVVVATEVDETEEEERKRVLRVVVEDNDQD